MTAENLTATNPYPVLNETHDAWQEGYEVGCNEAKSNVQKINREAGDLRVFERMILLAFIPLKDGGQVRV